MDRDSYLRSSRRSNDSHFSRQGSFRGPESQYTDLDPDYDGEQFYASVQRLIDRFQALDTTQDYEAQQSGYASEDVLGYEPWQRDFTRSSRRGIHRSMVPSTDPQYHSVSDIPSRIDVERTPSDDGDIEEYQDTGQFRRCVPGRQSVGVLPPNSRSEGYFGVRLSKRRPRSTAAQCTNYGSPGIAERDFEPAHPQSFQRSWSMSRHPDRAAFRASVHRGSHNQQRVLNCYPPDQDDARDMRHTVVDYGSDSNATSVPFRRNRFAPVRSRPVFKAKTTRSSPERNYGIGQEVVLNELHKRFPPDVYDVKRVSSRVTSPHLNGWETSPTLQKSARSREKSQERHEVHNPGTAGVIKKGLLKRGDEKYVDVIQESNSDTEDINTVQEPKIVRSRSGEKYLELTVDVTGFKPNDIQIVTQGKLLQVIARGTILKHTGSAQGATRVYRELKRQFSLPEVASAEHLQGVLNGNGVLSIHGPIGISNTNRKRKTKRVKFVLD